MTDQKDRCCCPVCTANRKRARDRYRNNPMARETMKRQAIEWYRRNRERHRHFRRNFIAKHGGSFAYAYRGFTHEEALTAVAMYRWMMREMKKEAGQ